MPAKISSNPGGRRYAGAPMYTPSQPVLSHRDGVVAEKPSALAHIAKVIGRKQLAYELRISKSLLDQMISGEKHSPDIRMKLIIRIAIKYCGPEMPLDIAQDLASEIGGVVLSAAEFQVIKQIGDRTLTGKAVKE